jgi:hypothetical protein
MSVKRYLAKRLADQTKWDFNLCMFVADRIAQTQRIRAISESSHSVRPMKSNLRNPEERRER